MNETKEMNDLNNFWNDTKLTAEWVNQLTIVDRIATIVSIKPVQITDKEGNIKDLPEFTLDFPIKKEIKTFLGNPTTRDNLKDGFGTTKIEELVGKQVFPSVKKFGNNWGIVLNPIVKTEVVTND